jgi:uncharacterized protein (TIGR02596 family)
MKTAPSSQPGFTLIEMIAVISIIAIVTVFVVPAATTILKGSQLTQASSILTDQISLARQQALTKNMMVEVRLIQFADPEQPGEKITDPTTGKYRAIQLMQVLPSGVAVPLAGGKVQILPQAVMMNAPSASGGGSGTIYSTLLAQVSGGAQYTTMGSLQPSDPDMPRNIKKNYNFFSFRFLPDGSTNLSPIPPSSLGNWYGITLHNITDLSKLSGSNGIQTINFFTLQLDPVSGSTRVYRPSAS